MLKAFEQHCTVVEADKGKQKRLKCSFCNEMLSPAQLYISLGLRVRKELRQLLARRHDMRDAVRKAGPGLRPLSYNSYRTTALNKVNMHASYESLW
jgi:hypothetical protein